MSYAETYPLRIDQLSLQLGKKRVLENVSFTIEPGQFVGLIGPNGAGKSSLLRCIYRYHFPSEGRMFLAETPVSDYDANDYARRVAVVLQDMPQCFNLTTFDVVALGFLPHRSALGFGSGGEWHRVMSALEKVGLEGMAKQRFDTLSGGEKQRAMMARAMVQDPALLILDEPTSHLDIKYQIQLMQLAKSLGVSVLASFHDLNLAAAVCDSILVLKEGNLIAKGSPHKVLTPDLLYEVFGVHAQVELQKVALQNAGHKEVPHIRYVYGGAHG